MILRCSAAFGLAVALIPAAPADEAVTLSACLDSSPPIDKTACLTRALAAPGLRGEDRAALRHLVESDPEVAIEAIRAALDGDANGSGRRAAREAADLLDLQAQARVRTGEPAEAATGFRAALALDDGTSRLRWTAPDGSTAWSASIDAGDGRLARAAAALRAAGAVDEAAALELRAAELGSGTTGRPAQPLLAAPPFPRAPAAVVPIVGGEPIELASLRGKVVLLDFWATWCPPCLRELPQLEELWTAQRERGLLAIAVNADEPDWVVKDTVERLGLTMPIGRYDEGLDEAFRVRSLPAVLLIDREGRIRGRWDGWRAGVESTIASTARLLLGDDPQGRPQRVADVTQGAGLLEVAWMSRLPAPVSGIASARDHEGAPVVLAATRSSLAIVSVTGEVVATQPLPPGSGSPRLLAVAAAAGPKVIGWRPGSTQLITIDGGGQSIRSWQAPAPVMDIAAAGSASSDPAILLATVEGLAGAGPNGTVTKLADPAGSLRAEAVAPTADGWLAVLGTGLRRIDRAGRILGENSVDEGTRLLTAAGTHHAGWGTAPSAVAASAFGRLLPGGGPALAAAHGGDRIVLVNLESGEVAWRATWPDVSALAVVDLDGDGRDELIVAAGTNLFALRAIAPRS